MEGYTSTSAPIQSRDEGMNERIAQVPFLSAGIDYSSHPQVTRKTTEPQTNLTSGLIKWCWLGQNMNMARNDLLQHTVNAWGSAHGPICCSVC